MPVIITNPKIILPDQISLVPTLDKPVIGEVTGVENLIDTFDFIKVVADLRATIDVERLVSYSSKKTGALSGGKVSYSFEDLKKIAKKLKIYSGSSKADYVNKIKEILYEE